MPKPMSMADKIRAKKAQKVDPKEREKERAAVAHALDEPKSEPLPAPEKTGVVELKSNAPDKTVDTPRTNDGHTPDSSVDISAAYPQINGGQSTVLSTVLSADLSSDNTVDRSVDNTPDKTVDITPDTIKNVIHLSRRETQIYKVLAKHSSGFTTSRHLAGLTGISVAYIQKLFRFLRNKGAITYKPLNGPRKGYTFEIVQGVELSFPNEMKPIEGMEFITGYNTGQDGGQGGGQGGGQDTGSIRGYGSGLISSSSFIKTNLLSDYLSGPAFAYWDEKKLKPKKVDNWIDKTKMSMEDMVESLCHCADEMVRLGEKDKQGKPIENVFAWFWSRINQHGYYEAAPGYMSEEDKKLERAKQRQAKKETLAKELEQIRLADEKAEQTILFEEIAKDPEHELHKLFKNRFSAFQRDRAKKSKAAYATALRMEFDKHMKKESDDAASTTES